MYRFARRPRWIVSHLIVLVIAVLFIRLGFWQLDRLHYKRDRNTLWRSQMALPVRPVETLLRPGESDATVHADQLRVVTATGTYLPGSQVLVRGRTLNDVPGSWVLAALRLPDGRIVPVVRGWMANDGRYDAVPRGLDPPAGQVTVTGWLRPPEHRGRFGAVIPADGRLTSIARVDVARYGRQMGAPVLPAWVQLRAEQPSTRPAPTPPRPLAPPDPTDQGPHFSYAIQWFSFAAIGLIGYPLILRRKARDEATGSAGGFRGRLDPAGPDPDGPDPHDVREPGDPRLDAVSGAEPVGPGRPASPAP
ncbi:MAG: SURF1 family protein [Actinobacteria bacterium]|nr:SURF1 family protein [Actinomycetota bacterium]